MWWFGEEWGGVMGRVKWHVNIAQVVSDHS